jgi:Domain of unknown function (DUF4440)
MSRDDELLEIEHRAWTALSTDAHAAASFFEAMLAPRVLLLLPGDLVIDDRADAIRSMSGAPWSSFTLTEARVFRLDDATAIVAYRAVAHRGGKEYAAWCNSTYVRCDGSWRLALHQQTPTRTA